MVMGPVGRFGLLAAATMIAVGLTFPARAQPATDSRIALAQAQFDALPEAERRAIQTDLIWAGHLSALASGSFGSLTFRAINAAKTGRGAPDGVLAPAERQALAAASAAAQKAAGFRLVDDPRTGVRIGVPTAVLSRQEVTPSGGSRWQSADGKVTLDTSSTPAGEELAPLFERATNASVQGRRITYKLLRPDFFVVSGETATGKFYRRLSAGPQGLRGFSIGYDKSLGPSLDRLVIAVANSFDPFPTGPAPRAVSTVAIPGPGAALPQPAAEPPPARRHRTGLALGGGLVLVARASLDGCRTPQIAGRPATVRLRDHGLGLALLDAPGAALPAGPSFTAQPGDRARVTVLVLGDDGGRPVPITASGTLASGPSVVVALQPGQAGAPVFAGDGALAGIVTEAPLETGLVFGVAPARSYRIADATALRGFHDRAGLGPPPADPALPPLTTGEIVAARASALVAVTCGA